MAELDGDKHVGIIGMGRSVGTFASNLVGIKTVRVIDGDKFLGLIGLGKQSITSELVAATLLELGEEEVDRLMTVCTVQNNERSQFAFPELKERGILKENDICELQPLMSGYTCPEEIKKRIKHCKNPMEKINLQRELNDSYITKKICARGFNYDRGKLL